MYFYINTIKSFRKNKKDLMGINLSHGLINRRCLDAFCISPFTNVWLAEQSRSLRTKILNKYKPTEFKNYDLIANEVPGLTKEFKIEFSHLMKLIWSPLSKPEQLRNLIRLSKNHDDTTLLLLVWNEWIERGHKLDLCTQTMLFEKLLRFNDNKRKICIELLANYEKYRLSPSSSHFDYLFSITLDECTNAINGTHDGVDKSNKMDSLMLAYQVFGLSLFYGYLPNANVYDKLISLCDIIDTPESQKFSEITRQERDLFFDSTSV